jgi:hydrogenase maturation protease
MCTSRILIVGIGNPLRSDDGVGWYLATELSHEILRDDVHIIATQQLTPEISEMASRAGRVLFIDAAFIGEPGTLKCKQIVPGATSSRHSHELSPAGVLKLAQDLYAHCPPAYLLTIAGEAFSTGDSLSPRVTAALASAKGEILRFIDCGANEIG